MRSFYISTFNGGNLSGFGEKFEKFSRRFSGKNSDTTGAKIEGNAGEKRSIH
jgi:hypothetical protein